MWKFASLFFLADYSKALKEDWSQRHGLDPDLAAASGGILMIVPPVLLAVYFAVYNPPDGMTIGVVVKVLVTVLCMMAGFMLLQFAKKFFEYYLRLCELLHLNPKDTSSWKKWALTDMACKLLSEMGREVLAVRVRGENEGNYGLGGTNFLALAQSRLDHAYETFSELGVIGAVGVEKFILAEKEHFSA